MIIICDLIFSILILFGICWQYCVWQAMETWQFLIALLICYVGARYLLFSSLEFHVISSLDVIKIEQHEEEEEEEI